MQVLCASYVSGTQLRAAIMYFAALTLAQSLIEFHVRGCDFDSALIGVPAAHGVLNGV